jgi:hypothetical protein
MPNIPNIPNVTSNKRSISIFSILFYVIVFVLVIFGIRYFSTIDHDLKLFKQIRPLWLLVALITQAGTYFFNALVFKILLQVYTPRKIFSLRELFATSVVVLFFNQTIPSAGWSGKAFFSKQLIQKGVSPEKAISLMFIELMTFYIGMVLIICLLFVAGLFFNFPRFFFIIFLYGILAFSVLGTFMVIASKKKVLDYFFRKIKRLKIVRRQLEKYEALIDSSETEGNKNLLNIIFAKKKLFLTAIACTIGVIICDCLTVFALFLGFDIQINFVLVVVGYMLTQIATLVPVLPGALLIFEGGMTFFFSNLGVPLEAAVTVTLLYRCLSFWLPIPLGLFLFKKLQKKTASLSDG